jgi:hypothetical protein
VPVILAHGRRRQEDLKVKASLGYIAIPCLNKNNRLGTVVHVCNPSYLGDRNLEDHILRSAQIKG